MSQAAERLSEETVDAIRAAYAGGGDSVAAIRARFAVSGSAFEYWLDGGPATGPRHRPPVPRRRPRGIASPCTAMADREALVNQLWRAAAAQVKQIERRIAEHDPEPTERERDNRMLAVAARTLRELVTIDQGKAAPKRKPGEAEHHADDEPPRDIDELRRDLARRIQKLLGERGADPAARDDEPG